MVVYLNIILLIHVSKCKTFINEIQIYCIILFFFNDLFDLNHFKSTPSYEKRECYYSNCQLKKMSKKIVGLFGSSYNLNYKNMGHALNALTHPLTQAHWNGYMLKNE